MSLYIVPESVWLEEVPTLSHKICYDLGPETSVTSSLSSFPLWTSPPSLTPSSTTSLSS